MSERNLNTSKNSVPGILVKGLVILCFFAVLVIVIFVLMMISAVNQFEKDFESRFVYSEGEMESCLYNRYGKVTLLDSYYSNDPEPQRICNFKDEKHGFTFNEKKKKGDKNQLTAVPLYLKTIEDDYEEKYFSWLEEKLKPLLEQEGIELFNYTDIRYNEISTRSFSVRQRLLITTPEKESSDYKIIMDAIKSYVLPPLYEDYDIEVKYIY